MGNQKEVCDDDRAIMEHQRGKWLRGGRMIWSVSTKAKKRSTARCRENCK